MNFISVEKIFSGIRNIFFFMQRNWAMGMLNDFGKLDQLDCILFILLIIVLAGS